jgi:hypothetical protein
MKKTVRLTESDLNGIVRRVLNEENYEEPYKNVLYQKFTQEMEGDNVSIKSKKPNQVTFKGITGDFTLIYRPQTY